MKKILFGLIGGMVFASSAFAIAPSLGSQYDFHLYFDNGQLAADRDYQFKYDVLAVPYEEPSLATNFRYLGEIIRFTGDVAATFKFDPRNGSENFKAGKISVKAPYVADAQKAIFYDPQHNPILTIPVGESSFCNDDGICNEDRGENYQTCSRDCKAAALPAVSATPTPTSTASSGSNLFTGILYLVIGVVLIAGFWRFLKRKSSTPPPPALPGNTL
jgi:hypothetical protein